MFMLYIRLISFGVKISEENLKVFVFLNFIESWLKSKNKSIKWQNPTKIKKRRDLRFSNKDIIHA